MRPERLYLNDIVEAVDSIEGFLDGIKESELLKNDLIRSAVLQTTEEAPLLRNQVAEILARDFPDETP
jgi:hypothetical protein